MKEGQSEAASQFFSGVQGPLCNGDGERIGERLLRWVCKLKGRAHDLCLGETEQVATEARKARARQLWLAPQQ